MSICPHGREDGHMCPHCLGVDILPTCMNCGSLCGCSSTDALRAQIADVDSILEGRPSVGVETPVVTKALSLVSAFADLKDEIAERDATIAVMRAALEHVDSLHSEICPCGIVPRALSSNASQRHLERDAAMQRVVEAARKIRLDYDGVSGAFIRGGAATADAIRAFDELEAQR